MANKDQTNKSRFSEQIDTNKLPLANKGVGLEQIYYAGTPTPPQGPIESATISQEQIQKAIGNTGLEGFRPDRVAKGIQGSESPQSSGAPMLSDWRDERPIEDRDRVIVSPSKPNSMKNPPTPPELIKDRMSTKNPPTPPELIKNPISTKNPPTLPHLIKNPISTKNPPTPPELIKDRVSTKNPPTPPHLIKNPISTKNPPTLPELKPIQPQKTFIVQEPIKVPPIESIRVPREPIKPLIDPRHQQQNPEKLRMQKSMKELNTRRARLMENLQSLGRTGQETQTRMEEWKRQASRQHRPVETWRHSGMLHRMESQMGDIMRSEAKVRSKLNEVRHRLHQTSTSLMHRYGERGR